MPHSRSRRQRFRRSASGHPGSDTLTILFLTELVFGAAAGGKESFVVAVLAVAIPFSGARHRVPKAALIAMIAVFLAIVIPFNQAYRNAARQDSVTLTPGQAIAAAPQILSETLTGQSFVTVLPNSVGYLIQRIREIDSVAIVVQRTPGQIGFVTPAQLIEAPLAGFVPRAVWPGKPIFTPAISSVSNTTVSRPRYTPHPP